MKTKSILITAILLLSVVSGFAQRGTMQHRSAQMPHPYFAGQPEFPCFDHIPDLTEAQRTQIKTIRTNFLKIVTPLKNQLAEKRAHLKTITAVDNPNQKEIDKTVDEIGNLRTTIMKERITMRQKIRHLLTDEQKVYFDAHTSMRKHHKHKGFHRNRPMEPINN